MIHIERNKGYPPLRLQSAPAEARRKAAAKYFGLNPEFRGQRRFDFSLGFAQPAVRNALLALFHEKCAYCEQRLGNEPENQAYVDRFRPSSGAIGADGDVDVNAYWWLAYSWENMYACCAGCNRAKGSHFPVDRKRLEVGKQAEADIRAERAVLLDPCADDPAMHLWFDGEGRVSGMTIRGRTTVELLSLNRPKLVERRKRAAVDFLEEIRGTSSGNLQDLLVNAEQEFAGMRRQLLQELTGKSSQNASRLQERQETHERQNASPSLLNSELRNSRRRARTRYIRAVTLINVGVHSRLKVELASSATASAPWIAILGENGVGKSTFLKAIAFALAGQEQWGRLAKNARGLLPPSDSNGVAEIIVELSDGETIELRLDARLERVGGNAFDPKVAVIGFGSTRLPPTPEHLPPREPSYQRLRNLFDPFEPLGDASAWLLGLDALQFEWATQTLLELLGTAQDQSRKFSRGKGGNVLLHEAGRTAPVPHLSDGYQTVIGIGCDIMSVLLTPDMPPEFAEGVVLIDEIGNHLHPRWRMRIVSSLKRAFPRVQFIVTTHEPLCLRGLVDKEVTVLRKRLSGEVIALSDLPPIKGMLVDQILSSQYFGMHSTIDPEFEVVVDRYYELLALRSRSSKQSADLEELEVEMRRVRPIGKTPTEQIFVRKVDEYLAKADRDDVPIDPAQLPPDVEDLLLRTLEKAESVSGENRDTS